MKSAVASVLGLFLLGSGTVHSATELIINGNFERVGIDNYSGQIAIPPILLEQGQTADALAPGGSLSQGIQTIEGWTTTGYNFLFTPGAATSGGAGTTWNDYLTFWGTPGQNGGKATTPIPHTSPTGGNFVALDSNVIATWPWVENMTKPIEQVVNGLDIGQEYELTFYWAAAQQYGFDGDTWDFLTVSFGEETYVTEQVNLPEHSFRDWVQETVRFTASATSQTLSFLAGGGPEGQPPFVLLDGVSMKAVPDVVPEPGTIALLVLGAAGFAIARRRAAGRSK